MQILLFMKFIMDFAPAVKDIFVRYSKEEPEKRKSLILEIKGGVQQAKNTKDTSQLENTIKRGE